jgi:enolase
MLDGRIVAVTARELLDSKARPMVEVDVRTASGLLGRGSAPCGTSVGKHEAVVLRDGGTRYGGLGVRRAVRNVREVIAPALLGKSVSDQRTLDQLLVDLDGTPDKSRLGANAVYSVSIAVARAGAATRGLPLFRHLGGEDPILPVPMFNMVNGGTYGSVRMEVQEFLLIPLGAASCAEAEQMGVEIFTALGQVIAGRYGNEGVAGGSYAGHAAPTGEPCAILDCLLEATERAGYGGKCRVGLDCAASHFYDPASQSYRFQGKQAHRDDMIRFLEELTKAYSLFILEDPLEEDDFEGFAEITRRVKARVVGDDFFVTNLARLKRGIALGAANAMILKPNMVGTISEALAAACHAKEHGYWVIGSGRAGGSVDDPIPDVAVAAGAALVKFGAPRTGERLHLQNCLLRMEDELGAAARFAGTNIFRA